MKIKLYERSIRDKRWVFRACIVITMLFVLLFSVLGQQRTFTINGIVGQATNNNVGR